MKELNNSIQELFTIEGNFRHLFIRQENLQKETKKKEIDDQNMKIEKLTRRVFDLEEQLNRSY